MLAGNRIHACALLLPILLLFFCSSLPSVDAFVPPPCSNVSEPRLAVVNIAILVLSPNQQGSSSNVTVWPQNPILDPSYTPPDVLGRQVLQAYQLYIERIMLKDGSGLGGIPMLDNTTLKLNFTFVHAGAQSFK